VLSMADGKVHMVGVICGEDCPVVHTPLRQLSGIFPNLPLEIAAIVRDNKPMIAKQDDQMLVGDEVYFFTDTLHLHRVLAAFGHEEKEARHVVVLGGGNIGMYLSRVLHEEENQVHVKVVERDLARAMYLSEQLHG